MADLTLGHRRLGALVLALIGSALVVPAGAEASSGSVVPIPQVPAGTQAVVQAAVDQATADAMPTATAAAAAAPVAPTPQVPHISSSPAAAAAAVAQAVPRVSVPAVPQVSVPAVPQVTVPAVADVSSHNASAPSPDPQLSAPAGAMQQRAPVRPHLAGATRPSGGHVIARRSGRPQARPRAGGVAAHQAARRVDSRMPRRGGTAGAFTLATGASAVADQHAGSLQPVHAAHVPDRRGAVVVQRAPARHAGLIEATATPWPIVLTTASLPSGGAGGPSAGGSGGAAGGIAAAVLALAALALLRGFLPGLLALDVVPWRSALLTFRLERPG